MRVIGANELRSGALERREGERQVLRLLEEAFEPADTPLNQGNWVAYYGSVIRQLTAPLGVGVKQPSRSRSTSVKSTSSSSPETGDCC